MKNPFELKSFIIDALDDLNFKDFTEIQYEVIPKALRKKNIIGHSRTGSGKSHSFLIPVFNTVDPTEDTTQVLISAPTRELAQQIYDFAIHLASFSEDKINIKLFSGGTDRAKEIRSLENSTPHIVIGTPGKIADLAFKENALLLNKINTFIIDEADMAMESGFLEELEMIINKVNKVHNLLVFSATFPKQLKEFIGKYMQEYEYVKIEEKDIESIKIEHNFIICKNNKNQNLSKLIKIINPYLALIFANTKEKADEVAGYLKSQGQKVGVIHGGLQSRDRNRTMNRIRNLEFRFVVATDLAARGIDIPGVSHVINYELPRDLDFYTHRSGRTGRAGNDGLCYTLYEFEDEYLINKLVSNGIEVKYKKIENDEIVKVNNRTSRKERVRPDTPEEKTARKMVAKPKKVKPGYKKKNKEEVRRVASKIKNSTKKPKKRGNR